MLPQQRSVVDRLVDYIVGDGPSNRYALICRQCDSHNGMALKEEFEYFGKFYFSREIVLKKRREKWLSEINKNDISLPKYIALGYRCCYCGFLNPARKQKPFAPKLEFDVTSCTSNTSVAEADAEEVTPKVELEPSQSDTGMIYFFTLNVLHMCEFFSSSMAL